MVKPFIEFNHMDLQAYVSVILAVSAYSRGDIKGKMSQRALATFA